MHNLTGNDFLSGIVRDLKMEHKELLYFLSLQIKLYQHLIQKRDAQAPLTLREKEFIELYEDAMNHQSKTGTRVKRQNKFPKRKKATIDNVSDGWWYNDKKKQEIYNIGKAKLKPCNLERSVPIW